ncbi:MAG: hypothetical protein GF400_07465 [Candidatus Eisenbacteria bacterium]|nr:hypothetical protein [Candidatus Eisenbacteria bacterium]
MPEDVRLRVRRARPSDREPLMDMSTEIWGGTDYLPLVWDEWLADERGVLLTATLDGVPVGVSKISVLSPGEIWLEGLRLHPDLQGKGLVRQINRAAFREAMKLEPRSIRYSTGAGNAASRHLGEIRGFWMVARTNWLWGKALKGKPEAGRPARADELPEVRRFIHGSECYRATGGLCARGWKFPELNARRIRKLVRQERVLVAGSRGKINGAAVYDIGEIDGDVCLGFLEGPDDVMAGLARDVLRRAGATGREEGSAMLPVGRAAETAFEAGYDRIIPANAVVYELGPRGFVEDDEPFESLMDRTLRAGSSEIADRLADLLVERAPRPVDRENVRDYVMRNLIPDTLRESYAAIEEVQYRLESWELRAILRAITRHFMERYGIAGDAIRSTTSTVSYYFLGERVALVRLRKKSLTIKVGPGFGPCFPKEPARKADEVSFPKGAFDLAAGKYRAIQMTLSREDQLPDALRAIDRAMKSALSETGSRG